MSKYAWQTANICDECDGGFMSYQTENLCPDCKGKQNMNLWEVQFSAGYKGMSDSVIIEAPTEEWADEIFELKFPKKHKYIFHIGEFQHKEWMKPLEQIEIYKHPYPETYSIDWENTTMEDVANAIGKAFNEVFPK